MTAVFRSIFISFYKRDNISEQMNREVVLVVSIRFKVEALVPDLDRALCLGYLALCLVSPIYRTQQKRSGF